MLIGRGRRGAQVVAARAGEEAAKDGDDGEAAKQAAPEGGAKILSLDQFRKK